MPHDLPKAYDPGAIEARWAEYWVNEKLFHAALPGATSGQAPRVFTLLLPPPNVTGFLHMGHMLEHTESDITVRWQRMRGYQALWLPGTDHAGIATQMLVERQLASEGVKRREMGRGKFIERVWQWREHYGGAILGQMKRLGTSVDWSREYFTMDDRLTRAVREAFVRLYEEGLIYRGKYIVNWCPRCMTAISDLEVVHEETQGKLYEIRYPVVGGGESVVVATTRPETMLGDTAVAVNEKDPRYQHLHGKTVRLPLMNRGIPIITDDLAKPEFGTGAVKVTPAHDPNDFEAGLRHMLPQVDVMDETAHMNENAGPYAGLDRFEARRRIIHDLEQQGLLVRTKDYLVPLGKCDRCKTIVEPRLSTQWFVKIEPLAKKAIAVVEGEDSQVRFVPENYKAVYLNWMRNIYDWCISRQLWWGHRIPAWHCPACRNVIVARETPAKCEKCGGSRLEQDQDVLDTWFSSGLLPMSALGWPDKTPDLDAFYPTSLLITGFDILFFWVARMIMLNCHFMEGHKHGSVPFRHVYIHALVRDAERQKMSKTKGNVMDPIEVIEKYGTDAVRFTLASMAAPGTDIAFAPERTEGYRNFANKIWNAARFIFLNVDRAEQAGVWSLHEFPASSPANAAATLEDRWIFSRFHRTVREVDEALRAYRFHEAAHEVYDFFWAEFCDWYIEIIKLRLSDSDRGTARTAFFNLMTIFEGALRLLSPFMPFITEELWHAVYDGKPPLKSIALAAYPQADVSRIDDAAETEMAILQDLIVSVRNIRAELKIETKARVPIRVFGDAQVQTLIRQNRTAIEKLANVEGVEFVSTHLAKETGARSTARFDLAVVYEQKIDIAAERHRLQKELAHIEGEMARLQKQLQNEQFLAKAPANVIEGMRKRLAELEVLVVKVRDGLKVLGFGGGNPDAPVKK
ncbi:MAG: valine--tRNA ligase [Acidobacteriia bacterium]|nr:valine--tRNA ligase [Terriglobia bacterium]